MTSGWQERDGQGKAARFLSAAGQGVLVLFVLLLFFLLNLLPLRLFGFDSVRPPFLLMVVFYWTIFRPGLLGIPAVFFLGVALDAVSGWPLGISALILMGTQWIAMAQRKFFSGQSFLTVWWGYLLISFFALFLQWGVFSLIQHSWLPIGPVAISGVLGAFVFPFAVLPLYLVHKILSAPQELT